MTPIPGDPSHSSLAAAVRIGYRNRLLALPFVLVGVLSTTVMIAGVTSPLPAVVGPFADDLLLRLSLPQLVPVGGGVHVRSSALAGMKLPYLGAIVGGTLVLLLSGAYATAQVLWWADGNEGVPPGASLGRLVGYTLATTGVLLWADASMTGDALTLFAIVAAAASYACFFVPVPIVLDGVGVGTAMRRSAARFVQRPISNPAVVLVVANVGHVIESLSRPLGQTIVGFSVVVFGTVAIGTGLHAIVLVTAYRRSRPSKHVAANRTAQPVDD